MRANPPYFMTNKDWYYYDEEAGDCKLTDKAPPEAVKSYNEYYDNTFKNENGELMVIDV